MKHRTLQDLSDKELLRMKIRLERKKILTRLAKEIISQRKRDTKKAQVIFLAQYRAKRLKAC